MVVNRRPSAERPWVGLATALAVLGFAGGAGAQEAASPPAAEAAPAFEAPSQMLPVAVVGVIDYQKILRDSKAATSIREQVEVRRKTYQDEIGKQEQRLRDQDQALAKQRTVLSADAFAKKRKDFEKDVAEVQRVVQDRRRQLDEVTAVALSQVREAIIQVVAQLAEVKGFNLVVPSSTVLVFSPRIDITADVLLALDTRLPDVKVADAPPPPAKPVAKP